MHSKGLTLGRCEPGQTLAKRVVSLDPLKIEACADTATMQLIPVDLPNGLDSLAKLLARLEREPRLCVFHGAPAEGVGAEFVPRRAAEHHGDSRTILPCAREWLALDLDSMDLVEDEDFALDPGACVARVVAWTLPECLREAAYVWQATGSAGFKPGLRARVWFWLDAPIEAAELVRIARAFPEGVDKRLYDAGRIHYTAAPELAEGIEDPMSSRMGRVEGGLVSVEALRALVGGIEHSRPVARRVQVEVDALRELHPIAARAVRERAEADVAALIRRVRKCKEGERNSLFNAWAYKAGQVARYIDGGVPAVKRRLLAAQIDRNDPTFDAEAEAVIDRSVDQGAAEPSEPELKGIQARLVVAGDAFEGRELYDSLAACLAEHDSELFTRAGMLVRVRGGAIQELPVVAVHEHLETFVRVEKKVKRGDDWSTTLLSPPLMWADKLRVRLEWPGMRALAGITDLPVLRPDGTVLETPGWDDATGLVYSPRAGLAVGAIPEKPTRGEGEAALRLLLEAVRDFPFATPRDRASAIACMLSPLARAAVRGPVPLFLFDAPTAGTGKSLLADVCAIAATGLESPKGSAPIAEEEWVKVLTGLAIAGRPLHCFDNVSRQLGGDALCKALTESVWAERKMGTNEALALPWRTCLTVTGNNVVLRSDMHRRVIPVRVDAHMERPEARTGFAHGDLVGWALENAGSLVAAGLTVLRAFTAAGSPEVSIVPMGSYGAWSAIVRRCLVWYGLPDVGEGLGEVLDSADQSDVSELMGALWVAFKGEPFTAAEVWTRARGTDLQDLLDGLLHKDARTNKGLGNLMRRLRGRVVGGRTLVFDRGADNNRPGTWRIR